MSEEIIALLGEIRDLQKQHIENYKLALANQQQTLDTKASDAPGENDVNSRSRPGAGDLPPACGLVGIGVGPSMCAPPIISPRNSNQPVGSTFSSSSLAMF